jgi:hypothetical protein
MIERRRRLLAAAVLALLLGSCGGGPPTGRSSPASSYLPHGSDLASDLVPCPGGAGIFAHLADSVHPAGPIDTAVAAFANHPNYCETKPTPAGVPLRQATVVIGHFGDAAAADRAFNIKLYGQKPDEASPGAGSVVGSGTGFGKNSVQSVLTFEPGLKAIGFLLDWQRGPYIVRFASLGLTFAEGTAAVSALNRRLAPDWSPCSEPGSLAQQCVGPAGITGRVGYYRCPVGSSPPACPFKPVAATVYVARSKAPSANLAHPILNRLTGGDGSFALRVPAGTYWIGADSFLGEAGQEVNVESGRTATIVLALPSF